MNYELAKLLKEAGFPGSQLWEDVKGNMWVEDRIVIPTLSELIEACGKRFELLVQQLGDKSLWITRAIQEAPHVPACQADGKTPEEAVAKLWLALKVKEKN